jgi:hypothetical protein
VKRKEGEKCIVLEVGGFWNMYIEGCIFQLMNESFELCGFHQEYVIILVSIYFSCHEGLYSLLMEGVVLSQQSPLRASSARLLNETFCEYKCWLEY